MAKGLFGNMFDFNRDGKMSVFERAAEFAFVEDMLEIEDKEVNGSNSFGDIEEEEQELAELSLMAEGLDYDELSFMDEDERREAIENAGLDPDDYDFD